MKRALGFAIAIAACLAVIPGIAFVQEQNSPPPLSQDTVVGSTQRPAEDLAVPNLFGVNDFDVYSVSFADFFPAFNFGFADNLGSVGERWTTAGGPLITGLEGIPTGALIGNVVFYFRDSNATASFSGFVTRYGRDYATGASPFVHTLGTCTSDIAGAPGHSLCGIFNFNHTVLRRGDFGGAAGTDLGTYTLQATMPSDGTVTLGQVEITWKRQLGPDPGTATFTDVPLGHPQRRFVESLVAAGITGGCGGGNYCPDAPVTRGQMAVFLSAALGLHWEVF